MSLAQDGRSSTYSSALDLGGGPGGGGTAAPPPAPEAPASTTAPVDKAAEVAPKKFDRANLPEEIVIALLDAVKGPLPATEIQEQINAKPDAGAYVPLGVVEKHLLEMETAGKVRRVGSAWELVGMARAEYETPAKVIIRRAELVMTLLTSTFPDGNDFEKLQGVTLLEMQESLRGREDASSTTGALTSAGFAPRYFPVDVLAADLAALCSIGVLQPRAAAIEEMARDGDFSFLEPTSEGLVDEDAITSKTAEAEDTDDLSEGEGEDEEHEEELDAEEPAVKAPDSDAEPNENSADLETPIPPAYVFAPGMLVKVIEHGAVALVRPSVPNAAPEVAAAATDSATTTDRTRFEEAANARANGYLARTTVAETKLARLRTLLAQKRLEHLADEAEGPLAPPGDPGVKFFEHTQTVKMNDAEKAVILDEIGEIDDQIAEEEGRIEGAKLALSSAKTTGKERLVELREKRTALMSAKDQSERTYGVVAYAKLIPEGDAESGGAAVNLILAKDGDRILERKVLTPRAVAKLAFEEPKAKADDPQLSLANALLEQVAVVVTAEGAAPLVAPTSAAAEPTPPAIATTYDVILTVAGPNKMAVVKIIREVNGGALKAAATIVDNAPKLVKGVISMEEAEEIGAKLHAAGATVETRLTVVAPVDAAVETSKLVDEEKAAAAAAAAIAPKGKIALNPEGFRPFVHAVIIAAGPAGILRDEITTPFCALTGLDPTGGVLALLALSAGQLVKSEAALVTEQNKRLTFATRAAVLALVVDAGDTGLRDLDLGDRFADKFKVEATTPILNVVVAAAEAAVLGDDLSKGKLESGGNLLWLAGQTDPRRATASKAAPAEPAPPKGRGNKAKAEPAAKVVKAGKKK